MNFSRKILNSMVLLISSSNKICKKMLICLYNAIYILFYKYFLIIFRTIQNKVPYFLIPILITLPLDNISQTIMEVGIMMDTAWSLKQSNPEESILKFNKIREIAKEKNYTKKEIYALVNLSQIYFAQYKFKPSMKYLLEAKNILFQKLFHDGADSSNYYDAIGVVNNRLGLLHFQNKDFTEAKKLFKIALYYFEIDKRRIRRQCVALTNLGLCEYKINNYDKAIYYYEKALLLADKHNYTVIKTKLYNNISLIYTRRGNLSDALVLLKSANRIVTCDSDPGLRGEILLNIGYVFFKMGDKKIAKKYFDSAYYVGRKDNVYILLKDISRSYFDLYYSEDNYKEAIKYKTDELAYSDTILSLETSKIIADYYELSKIKEKEQEILITKKDAYIFYMRYIIILSVFIIFIIIALLSYFRIKNKNKLKLFKIEQDIEKIRLEKQMHELENSKLNIEISSKMQRHTYFALHLINQNEFLSKIKKRIKQLKANSSEKNFKPFNDMLLELRSISQTDMELNELNKELDRLNRNFIDKLKEKHPNLTTKDLRTCTYLRLGLSSKDISMLTNIEINSVIQNRYRLRTKLQLSKEQNLSEYLEEFA